MEKAKNIESFYREDIFSFLTSSEKKLIQLEEDFLYFAKNFFERRFSHPIWVEEEDFLREASPLVIEKEEAILKDLPSRYEYLLEKREEGYSLRWFFPEEVITSTQPEEICILFCKDPVSTPKDLQVEEGKIFYSSLESITLEKILYLAALLSRFPFLEGEVYPFSWEEGILEEIPERKRFFLFSMLFLGRRPSKGLLYLDSCGILEKILPELTAGKGVIQNRYHKYDVFEHSIKTLDALRKGDLVLRLAALLHDIGKVPTWRLGEDGEPTFYNHEVYSARMVPPIMKRLGVPKELGKRVRFFVREHMFHYTKDWNDRTIRRFLRRVPPEEIENLIALRIADRMGSGKKKVFSHSLQKFREHIKRVLEKEKELKVKDLDINGYILMDLGIPAGPIMGRILRKLLEEVKAGELSNSREELERRAKELFEEWGEKKKTS